MQFPGCQTGQEGGWSSTKRTHIFQGSEKAPVSTCEESLFVDFQEAQVRGRLHEDCSTWMKTVAPVCGLWHLDEDCGT